MSALVIVNPGDRDWTTHRYILAFGAYGWTRVMVWANSLEDALDEAIDWVAENEPGLLCDDQVREEYEQAIAEGLSEEAAQQRAEEDTVIGGNNGHYILAWEWQIIAEDPTREQVKQLIKDWT